jgi:hypothetical protein
MTHLTEEFHRVHLKWFPILWYVWHKRCTCLASRLALSLDGQNRASTWASSLRIPSVASKMILEPVVHSTQTMHLPYVKISTISKWTKMSIHLSLVTYEYHRVCPKRFLSQWYVWCKPWIYLALTPTLSPNGSQRDFTWPMSLRSFIGCVQNDFQAYGMFGTNCAPILRQD